MKSILKTTFVSALIGLLASQFTFANVPEAAPHFSLVLHDGLKPSDVQHIKMALDAAYDDVLANLDLTHHPRTTIQIWRDEEAYQSAMQASLGSRAPGSRGYITGPTDVRLLLTSRATAPREAVHEFVHAASLTLNPAFGNNPRWLWEAAAQYIAGEKLDPKTSSVFSNGKCPTLDILNSPFDRGGSIYVSGYLLGAFIVETGGREALPRLIRANGDTEAVLYLDEKAFETAWCDYVQTRYLR